VVFGAGRQRRAVGAEGQRKDHFVCPCSRATSSPRVRSHSQTARSRPADASRLPSGWKATEKTLSVCTRSTWHSLTIRLSRSPGREEKMRGSICHRRMVRSAPHVASRRRTEAFICPKVHCHRSFTKWNICV
jgi:hypothetical protein